MITILIGIITVVVGGGIIALILLPLNLMLSLLFGMVDLIADILMLCLAGLVKSFFKVLKAIWQAIVK